MLIDLDDQPRITDFGLAKRQRGDSGLTLSGEVLGSPGFMPPEQAAGKQARVGPPSDVYGIGAILYHSVTGRSPFEGATVAAVLKQLQEQEPVSPHLLNPSVPRDLETICLKCLEKDPRKRYPTAQQLADELGRFLRDEPILARPISRQEKLWRWCRRNPIVAGLLVGLLLAIAVGAAATFWQLQRVAESARQLRARAYASELNGANHALAEHNPGRALELIRAQVPKPGEADLRGFEWRYLRDQCRDESYASIQAHDGELHQMALSPDGRLLATTATNRTVKRWSQVAFSPDSHFIASGSSGDQFIRLWNVPECRLQGELFGHSGGECCCQRTVYPISTTPPWKRQQIERARSA